MSNSLTTTDCCQPCRLRDGFERALRSWQAHGEKVQVEFPKFGLFSTLKEPLSSHAVLCKITRILLADHVCQGW